MNERVKTHTVRNGIDYYNRKAVALSSFKTGISMPMKFA